MLQNTTDMRRNILTFQYTSLLLSQLNKEILLLLAKLGKFVLIFRPLSKTVRFNVLKVIPNEIIGNVKKQFVLF
jgi:small subunit ribosomal protein S11e